MNATCLCNDEMLRVYGIGALCEPCAAEWARWCEEEAAKEAARRAALPGQQLPLQPGVAA